MYSRSFNNKTKGSVTIECAIVLPFFLVCLFSLLYFVKISYIHEQVQYALSEAALELASTSYILEATQIVDLQQDIYHQSSNNMINLSDLSSIDSTSNPVSQLRLEMMNTLEELLIKNENPFIEIESTNKQSSGTIVDDILAEISAIQKETVELTNHFYQNTSCTYELIFGTIQKADDIAISYGIKEAMALTNNTLGTQMVKKIIDKHISFDDYQKWGIVNGQEGLDFSRSSFLLNNNDLHISVQYFLEMPFLSKLVPPIPITQSVKIKAFIGNGNFKGVYHFSGNDENDNKTVYITKNGTKYHTNSLCRYIHIVVKPMYYKNIKDKKRICDVCKKNSLILDHKSIVYSTDKSNIFHTDNQCWTINRDVYAINIKEAKEQGYSLCSYCKGE